MRIYKIIAYLIILTVFTACKKDDKENKKVEPNDFLSASNYNELVIEIQSMEGFAPNDGTLESLKAYLGVLLNKPNGISIVNTTIAAQGKATYSISDIENIEKDNRTKNTEDKKLCAYILFLDGDYAGNDGSGKVLGIQYDPTSMVLFEKTIEDLTGGIGQPSTRVVETSVIEHEFGHTLGLTNNGTNMQTAHQDVQNGAHCNNKDCLMYYATETSNFIANLTGGTVPTLDANCKADLKANGGK